LLCKLTPIRHRFKKLKIFRQRAIKSCAFLPDIAYFAMAAGFTVKPIVSDPARLPARRAQRGVESGFLLDCVPQGRGCAPEGRAYSAERGRTRF
jgi:hypothetical protein